MPLPVATTTLTVTRPLGTGDPYETPSAADEVLAVAVPGHVSSPSGTDMRVGGDQETVDAVAYLPAGTSIDRTCTVVDDATGDTWSVAWTRARRGLGLDHVVAGLTATKGAASS